MIYINIEIGMRIAAKKLVYIFISACPNIRLAKCNLTSFLISLNSDLNSNNSVDVSNIVLSVRTIVDANFKFVLSSCRISANIRKINSAFNKVHNCLELE